MYGKLREDDDGHWYLVPEKLCERWNELTDKIYLEKDEEKYLDLVDEFIAVFDNYRLSGGPQDLRIQME